MYDLDVEVIHHTLLEEKMRVIFEARWKELLDEVYKRLKYKLAVCLVEEYHVAVYAGTDNQTIVKANRSVEILGNSTITPFFGGSDFQRKTCQCSASIPY